MHTHFRVQHSPIDGSWEWVFIVRNKIVARSARTFRSRSDAIRNVHMIRRYAKHAEVDTE